ncbi:hypothetical protein B296_00053360 [Ensete ventricosum]|uniref:Uncharacterized protein n=1 Tax=Ensete ventricosum TaxID=4639 RepID=A0A426Y8J5_ENSVE|nr:hypothetical protein B296_00053360 [Ensete ventricosum]
MHTPNPGLRVRTLVLFPASGSIIQKSRDKHQHAKLEGKNPLLVARKVRVRLFTINKVYYTSFACDKKGTINSSEKGALFKLLPDNKAQMHPPSQIQGLPTSDDGQLMPVCAEVAFGRARERILALHHSVLSSQKEVLYLPVLR